jgi:hypothetical protein
VRIQALALLKRPQVDDGSDVAFDDADPQRLPDRDAVRSRPRLRILRGPDLAPQHPVVKEPDLISYTSSPSSYVLFVFLGRMSRTSVSARVPWAKSSTSRLEEDDDDEGDGDAGGRHRERARGKGGGGAKAGAPGGSRVGTTQVISRPGGRPQYMGVIGGREKRGRLARSRGAPDNENILQS